MRKIAGIIYYSRYNMCYDGKRRNFHYSEQIHKKQKNFHYTEKPRGGGIVEYHNIIRIQKLKREVAFC